MAFLLSPKTGGGAVSYDFVCIDSVPVSINGAAAQEYTPEAPGTVIAGDVVSVPGAEVRYGYQGLYLDATSDDAHTVKTVTGTMPYTVEAVTGAVSLVMEFTTDAS